MFILFPNSFYPQLGMLEVASFTILKRVTCKMIHWKEHLNVGVVITVVYA